MLNKVILIGYVVKDPVVREISDSRDMVTFSIAINKHWKDSTGQKQESTEFVNLICYNKNIISFIQQYIKKGSFVYIEGTLNSYKTKDSNDITRYSTSVIISSIQLLKNSTKDEEIPF